MNSLSDDKLPHYSVNERELTVSIVTPSFNQANFIQRTLESVLTQDYPNMEYWVIDGGSTDDSLRIIESYQVNPRLNWMSEPDQGQADAVRKGWALSQGEILGWLNSDDVLLPGAVTKAVHALQKHPEAAFVYSNYQVIDQDDRLLQTIHVRQTSFAEQLRFESLIPQQTVFVRRTAIEACGGINIKFHHALDQELWLRLLEKHAGIYIDETWAAQRVHEEAKTQADWGRLHEEFFDIVMGYARRDDIPVDVIDPAIRRSHLELFILRTTQRLFDAALGHLAQAARDREYPFNSPSQTIKHCTYSLRHWQGSTQAIKLLENLLEYNSAYRAHPELSGLLIAFLAYCRYQDGNYRVARSDFIRAYRLQPDLRRNRYLAFLPLVCALNGFPKRLRRAFMNTLSC
jgi:GT2 family glycosyltransferase